MCHFKPLLLRISGSRQHTGKLPREGNELFSNGTVCNVTSKLSNLIAEESNPPMGVHFLLTIE